MNNLEIRSIKQSVGVIRFRLNFIIFLFIEPAVVLGGNRLQKKTS